MTGKCENRGLIQSLSTGPLLCHMTDARTPEAAPDRPGPLVLLMEALARHCPKVLHPTHILSLVKRVSLVLEMRKLGAVRT